MKIYYASLVNSLIGVYYPIEAPSEGHARTRIARSDLAKLWCSMYTPKQVDEFIEKYGGVKLPDEFATRLCYDSYVVENL